MWLLMGYNAADGFEHKKQEYKLKLSDKLISSFSLPDLKSEALQ
jgi:hypothetical protein